MLLVTKFHVEFSERRRFLNSCKCIQFGSILVWCIDTRNPHNSYRKNGTVPSRWMRENQQTVLLCVTWSCRFLQRFSESPPVRKLPWRIFKRGRPLEWKLLNYTSILLTTALTFVCRDFTISTTPSLQGGLVADIGVIGHGRSKEAVDGRIDIQTSAVYTHKDLIVIPYGP